MVMAILIVALGGILFAMAGVPQIVSQTSSGVTTKLLVILCLSGPTISAARWLGLSTARPLELMFMNVGKNCLCFGYAMVVGMASFIGLFIVVMGYSSFAKNSPEDALLNVSVVLLNTLLATWVLKRYRMVGSLAWMWGSLGVAIACIFLIEFSHAFEIPGVAFFVVYAVHMSCGVTYGAARLLYRPIHKYAISVKRAFGWVPWPLSGVADRFRVGNVLLVTNLFPLVVMIGATQMIGAIAIVAVAIPIWVVEQLCLILFPDSQVLTESLGYLISAVSIVTLLTTLVL